MACAKLFRSTGIPKNNIKMLDTKGVINKKRKDIQVKTRKRIKIVAISAKNINKKRKFKINKKIFYSNPLKMISDEKIDIIFECIGLSDGISK